MIRKNRENRFRDRLNNLDKFFALVGGYSCDSSSSEEGIAWSPRNGPSVGHVDRGGRLRGEGGGYCCQWKQVGRNGDDKLSDFMWTKESVSPLGRPDLANRNENEGEEGRRGTEFVEENDAAERRRNASSTCLTVITRARVHLLSAA